MITIEVYFSPTPTRLAMVEATWTTERGFHVLSHAGTPSGTATSEYMGGSLILATLTLLRLLLGRR